MLQRIVSKLRSSLSAKMALIVTLPIILITSFLPYHYYKHERDDIFQNAESRLLRMGDRLRGPVETCIKQGDYTGLQQLITGAGTEPDIERIALFSSQAKVVAGTRNQWIGKGLLEMHPEDVSKADITAILMTFSGEQSIYFDPQEAQYCLAMPVSYDRGKGALFIGLDLKAEYAENRRRTIESFVIAILLSMLIVISIYFISRSIVARRINSLSAAADSLASGDMIVKAEEQGTDEISTLAASFNALLEGISIWRNNFEEIAACRLKDMTALYEVVDTISRSLELNTVLPSVLDRVLESLRASKGVVVVVDQDAKTLKLMAHRGLSEESLCQIIETGQGCTGDVILKNDSIRVEEEGEDERCVPGLDQDDVRSALVVPVSVRGTVFGAFAVYGGKGERFSDQDEAILTTIGNQVGVAVENARLYEKTLELAQVDGLTGLANRRHLMERLTQEMARAQRYQTSLSVIILDLDKFKSFNDTYGHLKGDDLLKAFGTMVNHMVRVGDIVGRYGGEEFCVVLPNTSIKGAMIIAERIRKAIEDLKISVGDDQPPAGRTISIGAAEYTTEDSVEKLLSIADAALYRAKENGRNRVEA